MEDEVRLATRTTILACVGKAAENADPKDLVFEFNILLFLKPSLFDFSLFIESKMQRNDSKICDASFAKLRNELEIGCLEG